MPCSGRWGQTTYQKASFLHIPLYRVGDGWLWFVVREAGVDGTGWGGMGEWAWTEEVGRVTGILHGPGTRQAWTTQTLVPRPLHPTGIQEGTQR